MVNLIDVVKYGVLLLAAIAVVALLAGIVGYVSETGRIAADEVFAAADPMFGHFNNGITYGGAPGDTASWAANPIAILAAVAAFVPALWGGWVVWRLVRAVLN